MNTGDYGLLDIEETPAREGRPVRRPVRRRVRALRPARAGARGLGGDDLLLGQHGVRDVDLGADLISSGHRRLRKTITRSMGAASLTIMALRPDEFYDHARAAADDEVRLPLARMTGWNISPFEADGLRVSVLRPPVVPEPPRHGEDPADCDECRSRNEGIWINDRWRLARIPGVGVPLVLMLYPRDHYDMADLPDELAAELGVLTTHIVRHVQALPHISRAHVYRIGDGSAHLHVWFFARPEGQSQLYGSWLPVWDDLLPEYPADVAEADATAVARALTASYGGTAQTPAAT